MKIKLNDRIAHSVFGGSVYEGHILGIEICRRSEKYGRKVKRCDLSKHSNGVCTLDNGHWCYFYQIEKVFEDDPEGEDN